MQAVSKNQVKENQKIISDKNNKGFSLSHILSQIKKFLLSDIKVIKANSNSSRSNPQEFLSDESYEKSLEANHAKLASYITNNGFIK